MTTTEGHLRSIIQRLRQRHRQLSKKIESALSYQRVLGLNLKQEMSEYQWLEDADFLVKYNNKGVLCVILMMEGSAAYPSNESKTVVIDVTTGKRLLAADVFTNITGLTAKVKKAQKKEIKDSIAEFKKDPENKESNAEELFQDAAFTSKNLEGFSVNGKGVTFNYDYRFAHVIQNIQPNGDFFFTWTQLKPFIKAQRRFCQTCAIMN